MLQAHNQIEHPMSIFQPKEYSRYSLENWLSTMFTTLPAYTEYRLEAKIYKETQYNFEDFSNLTKYFLSDFETIFYR